jgi:peptidoglycan/LPS O-acetylase OafA/YrhL
LAIQYFRGFNGLRFLAAFFVLLSHGYQSVVKLGWVERLPLAVVNRGHDAVEFFFTLSGFLITYLLLNEREKSGTVSIRKFYLRRVLRIWPVYYLVLGVGLAFFIGVFPKLYGKPYFDFDLRYGVAAFVFFLPNLIATTHKVGLLFPLWSIGVEEQFYLFWAPLAKYTRLGFGLLGSLVIVFGLFMVANELNLFGLSDTGQRFLATLKFYDMAVGALVAWLLFNKAEAWFSRLGLMSIYAQLGVMSVLAGHYLVGLEWVSGQVWFMVAVPWLYAGLLLQQALPSKPLISFDGKLLTWLGGISYGIYMYHMLVDYALRFVAVYISARVGKPTGMLGLAAGGTYVALLTVSTIGVAYISYRYYEAWFLRLKHKVA